MEGIERRKKLKIPAKASLWYVISSAVARGVGVFGTPLFTRLLTAGEYGLYPLYTTWLGLITVIATLELAGSVTLRGLQKFSDRKEDFISAAFGLSLFSCVTVGAVYYAFRQRINSITGLSTGIMTLLFINLILNTAIAFYTAKCRYEYKYKNIALINLASAFSLPLLSVLIVTLTRFRAEGRILASVISAALVSLPILSGLIGGRRLFDRKIWLFLLKLAIPLLPHYVSAAVIIRITEITIGRSFGSSALGKYSVAMSLGLSLTMVTNGLLSALSPWMLRKLERNQAELIKDLLLLITKTLCIICLIILAVVPETIKIVTPPEYRDVLPAVYPLALSTIPMFLCNALVGAESYFERSAITALPTVAAAASATLITFLLLPKIDYRFAGLFVLAAYSLMTALTLTVFKKLSGTSALRVKNTLQIFAITAVYAFLLFLLRNNPPVRFVLILPLIPPLIVIAKKVYKEIRE